jgi:hypothetical protein
VTLTKDARDAIGRTVTKLRILFEKEFVRLASGRFGLHIERRSGRENEDDLPKQLAGHVEPLKSLSLTPSQQRERSELLGAVIYLIGEGHEASEAVARLIREATFTAVNRLLAVRVAEAVGVMPAALSQGRQSTGYRDVIHSLFPLLTQDEHEGLWTYLQVCGDELGASIPLLFDRRLPTSAFTPSRAVVDEAVAVINSPSVADVWREPEALGWAYQFFNSLEERQRMRAESQAPRTPRELAVRNQFFTPRYVVDWLVQNTLGRRLRQAGYRVEVPLLVGEIGDGRPLALDDVRVLDPAVGSGHFLLGCYDLLEQAWGTLGLGPADAAPRILGCLYGLDIDPRAAQVAQAVLLLRARRAAPRSALAPPAIATARGLPSDKVIREQVFGGLGPSASELARDIAEALEQASEIGSLLKVELRLQSGAAVRVANPQLRLGDHVEATTQDLEENILDALRRVAAQAEAPPPVRMFAADAADAIRFVEICQQRYDAVLMNPPFGDPIPSTRDYLRSAYGKSAGDLYAAFVVRGIDLLGDDGYLGAITSRAGFFLISSEDWRSEAVIPRLQAFLDLGLGVMHDAMVEAAAYVLRARPHHGEAVFRRLLDAKDKAAATYAQAGDEVFVRRPDDFMRIPGAPAAYWLALSLIELFERFPSIGTSFDARQGSPTADDFRYLRTWWEVPTSGALGSSPRWVSFAKGGDYSPYYAGITLCVDWDYQRGTFKDFYGRKSRSSPIPQNRDYFGRPGLTWSRRSQKGFSVRPIPSGCIFSDKGSMVFVKHDDPNTLDAIMGYLNSGLAATLLEALVAFGSYEVGAIQRLPVVPLTSEIAQRSRQLTAVRQILAQRDELDHLFVSPWFTLVPANVLNISQEIDRAAEDSVGEKVVQPFSAMHPTAWFESDFVPVGEPTAEDEVSYLLGAAMGRWDIRIAAGWHEPPPLPSPYAPLPSTSRGMLAEFGTKHTDLPADYPLQLPHDGVLHDDPTHPADVVRAIEAAANVMMQASGRHDLLYQRKLRDLRGFLRNQFFATHFRRYSVSRRVAPIYWYLSVPSKQWGLWLYAPALSRETLFAIVGSARDKLRQLHDQVQQLRRQMPDSTDRSLRERLEDAELLASEVETFAERADAVAQSGWEPDLNDGAVLCAAPLEKLFVDRGWQQEVTKHRKKLDKGEYPWATVQKTYFRSRS